MSGNSFYSNEYRCENYCSFVCTYSTHGYVQITIPLFFVGYYVYIETSRQSANNTAILESAVVSSTAGKPQNMICLQFWYHMYGQHVDTLSLFLKRGQQLPSSPTWMKSGTQGNQWRLGQVAVQSLTPFQVGIIKTVPPYRWNKNATFMLSFRLRPSCSKQDSYFLCSRGQNYFGKRAS